MRIVAVPLLVAVALGLAVATAAAQTPPPGAPSPDPSATPSGPSDPCGSILSIVTRPSVATAACPASVGHAVLETGYTNATTTGAGGGSAVTYPQALLHVGIDKRVDIEFTPPSYDRSSLGTFASGSSDVGLGAKWEIGSTAKAVYGISTSATLPTGSPAFTAGRTQYTGNANWGYTLDSEFSLAGTLSFNSLAGLTASGELQRYDAFVPSIDLAAALPGSAQVFTEYAFVSRSGPGLGGRSIVDFAYQRDFGARTQVDVEYGLQPNAVAGRRMHYVGAGLSFMN